MIKRIVVVSEKWYSKLKGNRIEIKGIFDTREDFVKYLSIIKYDDFFKIIDILSCSLDDIGVKSGQISLSSHPDWVVEALEEAGRKDILKTMDEMLNEIVKSKSKE